MPSFFDKDSFLESLKTQNPAIKNLIDDESLTFEILFHYNQNNNKIFVIKLDPRIRKIIMDSSKGFLFIEMARVEVIDHYHILSCFYCQIFGHSSSACSDSAIPSVCGKCTGPHRTAECTSETLKCINCVNCKKPNVDHSTHDKNKCSVYASGLNILKSNTDYGE